MIIVYYYLLLILIIPIYDSQFNQKDIRAHMRCWVSIVSIVWRWYLKCKSLS